MERQCDLEIHPRTARLGGQAPQEHLHRDVSPYCLSGGLIFAGLGAFDERNKICDATFEKRPPWPCNLLMVPSKLELLPFFIDLSGRNGLFLLCKLRDLSCNPVKRSFLKVELLPRFYEEGL